MKANELMLNSQLRARWSHFAWVLAGIAMATLIRFPIQPTIHNTSAFILYFPVVVVVAILFGFRFGLLATALSILPANYFWMFPAYTLSLDAEQFIQILGFSFAGFSVSWLSEAGRKQKRLEEHLRATLAGVGDAIVTTDCRGKIVYLNTAAQLLTEMDGGKAIGCALGDALNLFAENGRDCLSGTFQVAVNTDDIDDLPPRLIITSRNGRRYPVEQKTSRIVDARGQRLGTAILFHRLAS
jgi:PAS domain S-box-containing protein